MKTSTKLTLMMVATLAFAAMGGAALADCGSCGESHAKIDGDLTAYSAETNYMSLCGYARWAHAQHTGDWVSRHAACMDAGMHQYCETCMATGDKDAFVHHTTHPAGYTTRAAKTSCVDNPHSAQVHFMSGCGYNRWVHYQETGVWLSRAETCATVCHDLSA
jgi:hypothetical protein